MPRQIQLLKDRNVPAALPLSSTRTQPGEGRSHYLRGFEYAAVLLCSAVLLFPPPAKATRGWREIFSSFHIPKPENALFDLQPLVRESDRAYLASEGLAPAAHMSEKERLQRWASGIALGDPDFEDENIEPVAASDLPAEPGGSQLLQSLPLYSNYTRDAIFDAPASSLLEPARRYMYGVEREHGFTSKAISLLFFHYSPDAIEGKEDYSGFFGVDFYSNWTFGNTQQGVSSLTFELGWQKNLNGSGKDMGENVGSLVTSNVVHGDTNPIIGDIYLTQGFLGNRVLVNAGRLTPWYYYGYNTFTDSEVQRFSSSMFSGGVAIPDGGDNGTKPGASLQVYPTDSVYLSAVLTNTEGEDTEFDFDMFNDDAYFGGIEAGYLQRWESGLKTRFSAGAHTARKKQDDGTRANGNGFNLMVQTELSPRGYTPHAGVFLQYLYSDATIADAKEQLSAGVNINHVFHRRSDAFGFGIGTVKPADRDRRREYFVETYYRLQLTPNVQWSFNLQLFGRPSNPQQTSNLAPVFGTRIYFEL
jgi:hypothetical protein